MIDVDAIERVTANLRESGVLKGWRVTGDQQTFWTEYEPIGVAGAEVGIKIHVSSRLVCAPFVLRECISEFVRRRVPFKHAATLKQLSYLSTGRGGPSQIGKFITAYPSDVNLVLDLADALHNATACYQGPRIPNEIAYRPDSLVFFRYGSFQKRFTQVLTGRIAPARRAISGWEVDDRIVDNTSRGMLGLSESFDTIENKEQRLLCDKYVRVQQIYKSPKGRTHLGFMDSTDGGQLIAVKEAFAYTMEELNGRDAIKRLEEEAHCLDEIADLGIAPRKIDFWKQGRSAFLVYLPIAGATLAEVLADLSRYGLRPPAELLTSWCLSLCEIVNKLHSRGFVSCDLKPPNLVVTGSALRLIDLELAGPPTDDFTGSMGTPGYCSPGQLSAIAGRSFSDDIYAIGATLLAAAISTDASLLPDLKNVLDIECHRDPDNPIFRVVCRCISDQDGERYGSVDQIVQGFGRSKPVQRTTFHGTSPQRFGEYAEEIGNRILGRALRPNDRWSLWISHHSSMNHQPSKDLYAGSSGIALFLCELFTETDNELYLEEASRCGTWLAEGEDTVPCLHRMPGLYFGECGRGLLFLKLFLITNDHMWLNRAKLIGRQIIPIEVRSPDLMTGLAGVGLFNLALWHATHQEEALSKAKECVDELVRRKSVSGPTWRIPDGFEGLSGREFIGFSHGSAGIGYFFSEYCRATQDEAVGQICRDVADWLVVKGESSLANGMGLTWKSGEGDKASYSITWCHGASGIARFLISAYQATNNKEYRSVAERAGLMAAHGAHWVGTSQCHGLSGNLESLLDLSVALSNEQFYLDAVALGGNLVAYRKEDGWPSDERLTGCSDLMLGEAGIGAAFLRLANRRKPHLVSCAAFGASERRTVPAGGEPRPPTAPFK